MMKPANFPGRKNDRRKVAFAKVTVPKFESHAEKLKHPYYILKSRIVPDEIARRTRTKKDRSARGVFRK
jgi:hypothetical protein